MSKRPSSHPTQIPAFVQRDRIVVKMVTVWRMRLERFAFVSRRVSPKNPDRSRIEKKRTQERKDIALELRSIEGDLLRWIGDLTEHADLYSPKTAPRDKDPLDPETLSLHARLSRRWIMARQTTGSNLNVTYRRSMNATNTKTRHTIAQQIMDLEWKWLSALHTRVFPDAPLPPRRCVHPSRYKP